MEIVNQVEQRENSLEKLITPEGIRPIPSITKEVARRIEELEKLLLSLAPHARMN